MPLSRNEIKSRALVVSRHWCDAGKEDAEAMPFTPFTGWHARVAGEHI